MDEPGRIPSQPSAAPRSWIPYLHEFTFAANLVCSAAYGFLWYLEESINSWVPRNNLSYYFHRSALKLTDLLYSGTAPAVSTDMVGRESQGLAVKIGEQLTILLCVFAVTVLVLALTRLTAGTRAYRVIVGRLAAVSALLAMPGCIVLLFGLTSGRTKGDLETYVSYPALTIVTIFLAELLCIEILSIVNRRHPIRLWILGGLLILHYAFWLRVLWPVASIYVIRRNFGYYLLFLGFIASGFIWLRYLSWSRRNPALANEPRRPGKLTFIMASVSGIVLILLWFPARGLSLSHPKDMNTVRIEMARGSCFGSCPSYTLTIQASGAVEYSGRQYVGVHGKQTTTISREQVMDLLEDLDRIHFGALEDRAFQWCFDTPSVEVSVSMDGKTKSVASDAYCTGAKSGPQDKFVTLTNKIDAVTSSDRWVKCDGSCR